MYKLNHKVRNEITYNNLPLNIIPNFTFPPHFNISASLKLHLTFKLVQIRVGRNKTTFKFTILLYLYRDSVRRCFLFTNSSVTCWLNRGVSAMASLRMLTTAKALSLSCHLEFPRYIFTFLRVLKQGCAGTVSHSFGGTGV
jgi:hypothetical protein